MRRISVFVAVCCLLIIQVLQANQEIQKDRSIEKGSGSISGRITIQGKPVIGIELSLEPQSYHKRDKEIAKTITDKEGRYKFNELASSHYWVKVESKEYVNAVEFDSEGAGRRVTVASGESVQDADIAIMLGGSISGRITDAEGNPVAGIQIELDLPNGREHYFSSNYSEESKTDAEGKYKISGIVPGQYLVRLGFDMDRMLGKIRDKNDFSLIGNVGSASYFERTYFPSVKDKTKAKVVEIVSGVETKDISINIGKKFRAYSLSGRILDEEGNPINNYRFGVCRRTPGGGYSSSSSNQTDADGYFFIEGFLSGKYFIYGAISDIGRFQIKDTDFEIKDEDLSGVTVKAEFGLSISGSVLVEGNDKPSVLAMIPQLKFSARSTVDWNNISPPQWKDAPVNSDGTFKLEGLRSGNFEISISPFQTGQYFSIARIEYPNLDDKQQTEIILPKHGTEVALALKGKSLTDAKIIVRYKNGTIKCHVNFVNGKRPVGVRLMAWVTDKGNGGSMPEIDADGNFVEDGLDDGEYRVEIGDGMTRFTEMKIVKVTADSTTEVTFDLDVRKIKKMK